MCSGPGRCLSELCFLQMAKSLVTLISYELTELVQELVALLKPIVFWAKDNIETVKAARRDYETPAG